LIYRVNIKVTVYVHSDCIFCPQSRILYTTNACLDVSSAVVL